MATFTSILTKFRNTTLSTRDQGYKFEWLMQACKILKDLPKKIFGADPDAAPSVIMEHDLVELTEDLPSVPLYTGESGTVVHIYPKEAAYEVEFRKRNGEIKVETTEPNQIKKKG